MKNLKNYVFLMLLFFPLAGKVGAQTHQTEQPEKNKLAVLWSTGDREVFTKMMYIYILNAKKQHWFDKVTVIVWGPSSRLLAGDKEVQSKIRQFEKAGVVMEACVWCADQYGVTETLRNLDVDVKGMGGLLTKYIKDPETEVLVF
ncbi:MAG: DsrE family protein [Chlorobi bacterium]|nr:DsrE family protein [Chlorobiota bacterium]